ncbi:uncharacterized protein LOC125179316 [Hyalella azteca]|uniref:Uncharacterized protein LOC125179316 n=1 Tax=Hyalella azteca TaxID=294128 RepID=A0A979FUL1_HYAAZ|nr:uncharacterized protein LOC125179316 [Hyalella azteca]
MIENIIIAVTVVVPALVIFGLLIRHLVINLCGNRRKLRMKSTPLNETTSVDGIRSSVTVPYSTPMGSSVAPPGWNISNTTPVTEITWHESTEMLEITAREKIKSKTERAAFSLQQAELEDHPMKKCALLEVAKGSLLDAECASINLKVLKCMKAKAASRSVDILSEHPGEVRIPMNDLAGGVPLKTMAAAYANPMIANYQDMAAHAMQRPFNASMGTLAPQIPQGNTIHQQPQYSALPHVPLSMHPGAQPLQGGIQPGPMMLANDAFQNQAYGVIPSHPIAPQLHGAMPSGFPSNILPQNTNPMFEGVQKYENFNRLGAIVSTHQSNSNSNPVPIGSHSAKRNHISKSDVDCTQIESSMYLGNYDKKMNNKDLQKPGESSESKDRTQVAASVAANEVQIKSASVSPVSLVNHDSGNSSRTFSGSSDEESSESELSELAGSYKVVDNTDRGESSISASETSEIAAVMSQRNDSTSSKDTSKEMPRTDITNAVLRTTAHEQLPTASSLTEDESENQPINSASMRKVEVESSVIPTIDISRCSSKSSAQSQREVMNTSKLSSSTAGTKRYSKKTIVKGKDKSVNNSFSSTASDDLFQNQDNLLSITPTFVRSCNRQPAIGLNSIDCYTHSSSAGVISDISSYNRILNTTIFTQSNAIFNLARIAPVSAPKVKIIEIDESTNAEQMLNSSNSDSVPKL